ncbi:hypothetical protein E2C01_054327 [Portunus trituberculatus]|uniref:Uncharacterized protein n=1 Tax=Portunus trituberculatus TaxID=210409 RepID=A0A5B7GTF0_PORTR|nr:hypothetical protein [Portunus trituberculatus]
MALGSRMVREVMVWKVAQGGDGCSPHPPHSIPSLIPMLSLLFPSTFLGSHSAPYHFPTSLYVVPSLCLYASSRSRHPFSPRLRLVLSRLLPWDAVRSHRTMAGPTPRTPITSGCHCCSRSSFLRHYYGLLVVSASLRRLQYTDPAAYFPAKIRAPSLQLLSTSR